MNSHVLVVDGGEILFTAINATLSESYGLTHVHRVHAGHKAIATKKFVAIVCCLRLSDGSGLEVLENAKRRQPNALRILHTNDDSLNQKGIDDTVRDMPGKGCVFTLDLPRVPPPPLSMLEGGTSSANSPQAQDAAGGRAR